MSDKLTVIDFFCGGGGFSEGFRQAGLNVIWAVDLWQPAVNTHSENHPETVTIKDDVIRISNLPDDEFHKLVPDSDIIIGSPPCTAFSNSNKSGKADKSKGIALFEAYLKIVARKKFKKNSILKYWILENVPKVKKHLKDSYTLVQHQNIDSKRSQDKSWNNLQKNLSGKRKLILKVGQVPHLNFQSLLRLHCMLNL